jgi:glucose-6-phosphate 1-dehydrogenase
MLTRLLLFGATGDLTGRFLLPALAELQAAGELPAETDVLAAATEDWDSSQYCEYATEQLARHAGHIPNAARDAVVAALRYRPVDVRDAASVASAVADGRRGPRQREAPQRAAAPDIRRGDGARRVPR